MSWHPHLVPHWYHCRWRWNLWHPEVRQTGPVLWIKRLSRRELIALLRSVKR